MNPINAPSLVFSDYIETHLIGPMDLTAGQEVPLQLQLGVDATRAFRLATESDVYVMVTSVVDQQWASKFTIVMRFQHNDDPGMQGDAICILGTVSRFGVLASGLQTVHFYAIASENFSLPEGLLVAISYILVPRAD